MPAEAELDDLILVVAPTGRDAVLACEVLANAGLHAAKCTDLGASSERIREGAGALLLTEEAIDEDGLRHLLETLDAQGAWSDFPIVIFVDSQTPNDLAPEPMAVLRRHGNVMLLERPMRIATLVTTMQTALRGRRRQYEVRDLLAQLERGVRQRDEFLAMLAHELRNPLAAISTAVYLMNELAPPTQQTAPMMTVLDRQTRQLSRLIDDLLDVSRVTSGKVLLKIQPVNLQEVLQRSLQAVQAANAGKGPAICLDLYSEPIVVEGDPVRLEQIVSNLLGNATKYTPEDGRVDVTLALAGPEAIVRFRDNGLGITSENLSRIFELFQQSDRGIDRAQGGLGIGLTVVRQLAEMHGGSVEAHSDGAGKGSEFVLRLPVSAMEPQAVRHSRDVANNALSLRILLVEDNDDVRAALEIMLARKGHTVVTAADGLTAIDKARDHLPEVALIDIGLPGMDGYQVASELRNRQETQPFLIAVTGYGQPNDRQLAFEAGFDLHLTKPLEWERLEEALTQVRKREPSPSVPSPTIV